MFNLTFDSLYIKSVVIGYTAFNEIHGYQYMANILLNNIQMINNKNKTRTMTFWDISILNYQDFSKYTTEVYHRKRALSKSDKDCNKSLFIITALCRKLCTQIYKKKETIFRSPLKIVSF